MLGSVGWTEVLLILLIVLLLFGAKRIPEVMKAMGQGLREFKKASSSATEELKRAVDDVQDDEADKKV